ncbi:MAG: response regulator [Gammaproteobacteria bacterium]
MAVTAPNINPQANAKAKVLVIDDNRVIRTAIRNILSDKYDVLDAVDGEDGWSVLTANRDIDVVFSDLQMPELDGCGLLKRMRESTDTRFQNMPFIIITSFADNDEIKQKIYAYGADDFISKPFEAVQLLARTNTFVRLNSAAKQAQKSIQECKKQSTDNETGLGTLSYFERSVTESIAFSFRHGGHCVMMLIEIDNFNSIFIKNGKDVAVNIVTKIGKLFREFVRTEDKASRISLSKYAAFLTCDTTERAVKLAERLHIEIANLNFVDTKNEKIEIVPSIGIYMPKITKFSSYDEIYRKSEYCLKSAGSSQNIKIVSNSEIPNTNAPIQLSVTDAMKMIQEGNIKLVDQSKEDLFNQLEPLLKHIITDNKVLEKFVDELMSCLHN